jgi:ABC-type uncharacterized transport system ATPase subunit
MNDILQWVMQKTEIADMSIKEVEIEEIIKKIYVSGVEKL